MERKLSSKEIKKIEFDILCDFQDFCNNNDLHPVLAYGTLLGAIRHKGFIPWDDDIDVYLSRDEFERFIQIYNLNKSKQYYELAPLVEGSSQYVFAKVIDKRTRIERPSAFVVEPKYLWIDVFPLDGIPSKKLLRKIRLGKSAMYQSWFGLANTNPNSSSRQGFKGAFNRFFGFFYREIVGTERICRMQIKSAKKYKLSDCNDCSCFTWGFDGEKEVFPVIDLENTVDVEFEGSIFKSMANPEKYLAKLYGDDYMQLPPEEKRITHMMDAWFVE